MSGYIGTQPVPQATQTRDSFTATSGQTSFATGGYTPNYLDVYLNGVKLAAADYTASNGSDVVLASGASTGDILEVVAFTTFSPANIPSGTPSIDDNGNATAITINASESVLVGKSVDTLATSGTALFANGQIDSSVDGNYVAKFNRKSSDGTIIELRKDTTSIVGSIGSSNAGERLYMVNDSTGLSFIGDFSNIFPCDSSGTARDNAINLGGVGGRFKDLYLSGGAYLGGVAAANKLDDYEEGTWTPTQGNFSTWSSPTFSARYTKIGRLVRVQVEQTGGTISWGGYMGGLPFNPSTVGNKGIGNASNGGLSNLGTIFAYAQNQIWAMTGASNQTNVIFGISYFTDD